MGAVYRSSTSSYIFLPPDEALKRKGTLSKVHATEEQTSWAVRARNDSAHREGKKAARNALVGTPIQQKNMMLSGPLDDDSDDSDLENYYTGEAQPSISDQVDALPQEVGMRYRSFRTLRSQLDQI